MADITPGSWWRYNGPGEGRGVRHAVTSLIRERDYSGKVSEVHVATWGESYDNDADKPKDGWSWYGPVTLFQKHFVPTEKPT